MSGILSHDLARRLLAHRNNDVVAEQAAFAVDRHHARIAEEGNFLDDRYLRWWLDAAEGRP